MEANRDPLKLVKTEIYANKLVSETPIRTLATTKKASPERASTTTAPAASTGKGNSKLSFYPLI